MNLQREVVGTTLRLTESLRFQNIDSEPTEGHYKDYFSLLVKEQLDERIVPLLRKLRDGSESARRRIVTRPTQFDKFSAEIRRVTSSDLVKRALDIIAGFDPDETLHRLGSLEGPDAEYSVPQLKTLLKEVEQIMGRKISLPEWRGLS